MTATTDDFLLEARSHLIGAPDAAIKKAIERAIVRFLRLSHFWVEQSEVTASAGESSLSNVFPSGTILQINTASADGRGLRISTPSDIRSSAQSSGAVCAIAIDQVANRVLLWPTPSEASDIRIEAVLIPSRDAEGYPDFLFDLWHDAIVAGTIADMKAQKDKPWHNPNDAAIKMVEFNEHIAEARRRGYSGGFARLTVQPRRWL